MRRDLAILTTALLFSGGIQKSWRRRGTAQTWVPQWCPLFPPPIWAASIMRSAPERWRDEPPRTPYQMEWKDGNIGVGTGAAVGKGTRGASSMKGPSPLHSQIIMRICHSKP